MSGHPKQTAIFTRQFNCHGEGSRVAVKDTLDMVGEVTTGGSRALQNAPAARQDADVVSALRAANCQIVGRTNMHELAYGVTGTNSWTGTPTNPKYPRLIPGGSSSGSAVAVAASLADFTIGSDTGGSIRVPATCCGIVGLKPTFGRVSRRGAVPGYTTLDCIGPFARDVAGIEQAMAIIAPTWLPVATQAAGRKVAFVVTDTDQPIADLVRSRGEALFDLHDVKLADFLNAADGGLKVIARETWDAFGYLIETGLVGRDVHDRLVMSSRVTDAQLAEAEATRARFSVAVDAALGSSDALLLPAFPCPVPSLYEAADIAAAIPITTNCRPFNLSGHPALVLPVGEIDGRPVSLQLVGRKGGDEALCALARHIPLFEKGAAQ